MDNEELSKTVGQNDGIAAALSVRSAEMGEDEPNLRPSKRKKTTLSNLCKGPTMRVNTPSDTQQSSETTDVPEGTLITHVEAEIVSEIQVAEEMQSKLLATQTLQQLSNLSSAGLTDKAALMSVHRKIKEYQTALNQRDEMIGQLQSRLAETIQQRDELITTSREQEASFKHQTETLSMQLQQAIEMISNQKTGVNPADHLQLKNKLISLQQEKSQQNDTIEQFTKELEERTEVHGQLEFKYKQLIQKYKVKQAELEKSTNNAQTYQATISNLEGEIASWMKEKEHLDKNILSLREEKENSISENGRMRDEIQNLMQKLQEMAEEVEKKDKILLTSQAQAEEQFGMQLTLIKQQMSELHGEEVTKISELHVEEISKIKSVNESQIAKVSEEVEKIQRAHEEDMILLSKLKVELEEEKQKSAQSSSERDGVLKQLGEMKEYLEKLSSELLKAQSEGNAANGKLYESEQAYQQLLKKEKELRTEKEYLVGEVSRGEILKQEVSKLEQEVVASMEIEKNYALLKEENNQINSKCIQLSSQVETLFAEKVRLEDEVEKDKEEINQLSSKIMNESQLKSNFEMKYNEVSSQVQEFIDGKVRLESQVEKDKEEINRLNFKLQSESELKSNLEQKYSEISSQVNELTAGKEMLENQVEKDKEEISILNLKFHKESELKSNFEIKCTEMSVQVEELNVEKEKLEGQVEENNGEISRLNMKLQDEIKLKSDLEIDRENLRLEKERLNEENMLLQPQMRCLEEEKKTMEAKCLELGSFVNELQTEKTNLECEVKRTKEENERLNLKVQEEEKCRFEAETKYEHMKVESDKFVAENNRLNLCIRDLETEKGNAEEMRACITLLEGRCQEAKEAKEEYEKKCSSLNCKLSSLDKKLEEAHKLHINFDSVTQENSLLKQKLEEKEAALSTLCVDEKVAALRVCEVELKDTRLELVQLRERFEKMEKDKIDSELEQDKLMEQYEMMKAELASTMLALDREIQLSTHRRLSDIGLSLAKVVSDITTQTDESVDFTSQSNEKSSANNGFYQRLSDLEKENKDLLNEAEKMKGKLSEQKFIVKSYESELAVIKKRLHEMEVEKQRFKAEQQEYQNDILEKLDCQKQLAELKLSKNICEQTWRQQEKNVSILLQTLRDSHNLDMEEDLSKTVRSLELSFSESELRETFGNTSLEGMLDQTGELDAMRHELDKALTKILTDLEELDKVRHEKLQLELENVSLKALVSQLQRSGGTQEEEVSELLLDGYDMNSDIHHVSLRKEIQTSRWENENLRTTLERQKVLYDLEKQHLQSTKLKVQVYSIIEDPSETLSDPYSSEGCLEVIMKSLKQVILKNVSGQYVQTLKRTLNHLENTILSALHSPPLEIVADAVNEDNTKMQLEKGSATDHFDHDLHSFTERVEQLINIRTTLVDAANELVEQLEEAVILRLSPLKLELEAVLKVASIENAEIPVSNVVSPTGTLGLKIEPYQAFIQEFVEVTTGIAEEAQGEKLQILESQKALIQKILEDDKSKINNISHERLHHIENAKTLPDAVKCTAELISSLEMTLSEEIVWVNQQYKELMTQYTYEQELRRQAHTSKLKELEISLTSLLENSPLEVELSKVTANHKSELDKLKEDHQVMIKHLENQIAVQDNEMLMALEDEVLQLRTHGERDLIHTSESTHVSCSHHDNMKIQITQRHLQSLYSDRDWYRRTVGLLSHVTLQLLHYFSVAENYIKSSQSPHSGECEPQEDIYPLQPESISGVVKDLSFLSDCKTDYIGENVLSTFPEDSAMSTALIGKSIQGDHSEELELASNSGSMLDSTVMSEGLLDDMDKDEQVRTLLNKFYPQLMSILKGRWDRVVVECLEKEVQELTIALQASAGMLKIFLHSVASEIKSLPAAIVPVECDSLRDSLSSQNKAFDASQAFGDSLSQSASFPKNFAELQVQIPCQEGDLTSQEPQGSSHFGDVSQLTQDIMSSFSKEETFPSLAAFMTLEDDGNEKLKVTLKELCQKAIQTEDLKLKVHHLKGLVQGLEEEQKILQDENDRLEHYSKNLAMELQVTKDQLADYELDVDKKKKNSTSPSMYAERMEASKDTKERVRAVLSAKTKSTMDHSELVTRNADLERLLESLVQEHDKEIEMVKLRAADLSQQLEVADRQLRSNRQFLDEQAYEREKERDDLLQEKDKLAAQLREMDNLQVQHENMTKEVESLDRELQEKSQECEEALARLKDLQVKFKAAHDKISDQRDIIASLEAQLDAKNWAAGDLLSQNENLITQCAEYKQKYEDVKIKLEEHECEVSHYKGYNQEDEAVPKSTCHTNQMENEDHLVHRDGEPLSLELLESCEPDSHIVQNQAMVIEDYVKRIADLITSMMCSEVITSNSMEELSDRGQQECERALSPATSGQPLEERLRSLERTAEAAVKRVHDMQMTEKNLNNMYEELLEEKNVIQERMEKHAMEAVKLETRLDEFRRLDHPQVAILQQKITSLQDELESRRTDYIKVTQENKELRHSLSDSRSLLKTREIELQKVQSVSSEKSPEYKKLLEMLQAKEELIEILKKEKDAVANDAENPTNSADESLEELRRDFNQETSLPYPYETVGNKPVILVESSESLNIESSQHDPSLSTLQSSPQIIQDISRSHMVSLGIQTSFTDDPEAFGDKEDLDVCQEKLCSASEEVSLLKIENELLQKEIQSLNEYQAKLEEDFKSAQQLLDAREEEILELSEEVVDSSPQCLPSEMIQMQQAYQDLEHQFTALRSQHEELRASNINSHESQALQQEIEFESRINVLEEELDKKIKELKELEDRLQSATQKIKEASEEYSSLQSEMIAVENSLKSKNHDLEIKVNLLTCQLDTLQKQFFGRLNTNVEENMQQEKQYQDEIAELKNKQKLLIAEHEQEMSTKLVRKGEKSVSEQLKHYETLLQNVLREKEEAEERIKQLELCLQERASPSCSNLQYCDLSDSLKDLSEGVKEELNKSGRLDNSLVSYMRSGLDRYDSAQPSTTTSSLGDENENDVRTRLKILIARIQLEGIQALSSSERRYLQKHSSLLSLPDRHLITSLDISEPSSRESSVGKEFSKEQILFIQRKTKLKEDEIRKLRDQAELKLHLETVLSNKLKASLEAEKKRKQELIKQLYKETSAKEELLERLHQETSAKYDQTTEANFFRTRFKIVKDKNLKLHEENLDLFESIEMKSKELETYRSSLQKERSNFKRVSESLDKQRKLLENTKEVHSKLVKELQESLEEEREKSDKLYRELKTITKTNRKGALSGVEEYINISQKSVGKSTNSLTNEEIQIQLAMEQKQVLDLQRRYDQERRKVLRLREQAETERAQSNIELLEAQNRISELTVFMKNSEREKETMSQKDAIERKNIEKCLKEEIEKYKKKIYSLSSALSSKEMEGQARANIDDNNLYFLLNDKDVCGKNLRLRARWKSLVFQKQYLLTVIKHNQDLEQQNIARAYSMVKAHDPSPVNAADSTSPSTSRCSRYRLKKCALVVIAVFRMQFLVQRWQSTRLIGSGPTIMSQDQQTASSPSESVNVHQPESSNIAHSLNLVSSVHSRPSHAWGRVFPGQTPPTRGPSSLPSNEGIRSSRNLFGDQEPQEYDEYIQRLDNIHSQLGLNVKK